MEFILDIQGYYRDLSRKLFPEKSGIYFVYRGYMIPHLKSATLRQLLYIGEATDIGARFANHERRADFLSRLEMDEELFYCFAITDNLSDHQRKRVEAALIYELHPPLNTLSTESFEYDSTLIHIRGDRHAFIPNVVEAPTY